MHVHVISHTHWDREWYLTREDYRLRLVDLVDAVLDRMDADPAFTYFHLDGQTIVLGDYLEVRPEAEARLKRRIAEGRLLVGPWYVMPDMFLVSGEALVRNLAIGHRIAESFGGVMRAGYTPDPFGHVAQMPQILAGFGLDNAILWRGFGGPRFEYLWEGHDGTRTLLLHFPREGYCNAFRLPLLEKSVRDVQAREVVDREAARSSTGTVLLMAGVDHTEPHPELLPLIRDIGAREGVSASLSTLPACVDRVREQVRTRGLVLEVVRGEFRAGEEYSNLLPGVLSARAALKRSNVRAQALLEKTAEPLALFAWLSGDPHPSGVLDYAWRTLIENHPHDSICGCSIDEVHAENETRFARVLQATSAQVTRSLRALARRVPAAPAGVLRFLAVNTDLHPHRGVIDVTLDIPIEPAEAGRILDSDLFDAPLAFFEKGSVIDEIRDASGEPLAFEEIGRETRIEQWTSRVEVPLAVRVERVRLALLADLPAAGFAAFDVRLASGSGAGPVVHAQGRTIENDRLRLEVTSDGTLNVLDKTSGRTFRRVLELEDTGDVGDEYTFAPPSSDRRVTSREAAPAVVTIEAAGALRSALSIETSLEIPAGASADRGSRACRSTRLGVRVELEISQGSPVVSGRIRVDNRALDHRLRLLFPTGAPVVATSRADTAFGVVTRVARREPPGTVPPEAPVDTQPLQSIVDAGDETSGVTVMGEGLMEYEVVPEGPGSDSAALALTALRSVGWLSREDLSTRQGNAGPSLESPGAQCLGVSEFRFAFAPRSVPPSNAALCAMGRAFLAAPSVVVGTGSPRHAALWPLRHSFVSLAASAEGAVTSALKKADGRDAVAVRLYSVADETLDLRLSSPTPWASAELTDLRERPIEAAKLESGAACLSLGPRKIATLTLAPLPSSAGGGAR